MNIILIIITYGILEIIWNVIDLTLRTENCTTLKVGLDLLS